MGNFFTYDLIKPETSINILDVGAALNPNERDAHQDIVDRDVASVTAFEPDQAACDVLNKSYEGTNHRCFPYFIGDGSDGTFHVLNHPFCSSLYAPNYTTISMFQGLDQFFQTVRTEEVKTTRLDDIPDLGTVDYLKIDVQGAVLDVFRGAPKALMETLIVFVEVEFVELYMDQPLFGDIHNHLRERGFMFHCLNGAARRVFKPMVVKNDVNAGLRQTLWGDAWFIRDPRTYDTLSTDKLLKLALIAHEVLTSYDLVLLILGMVDERQNSKLAATYLSRF